MGALVTVQDVQARLGDTSPSIISLPDLIAQASALVVDYLGYDPLQQTVTETLSGLNTSEMLVNYRNITAVASITVNPDRTAFVCDRGMTFDPTNIGYGIDRIFTLDGTRFPKGRRNLTIVYTAGWAANAMQPAIKNATLITVKAIVTSASVDPNVASEQFPGVLGRSFWQSGAGSLPPAAMAQLNPIRIQIRAS